MKILLTNDDGFESEGLKALSKALSSIGEVYVIAPEREQSAVSHAITMHKPLRTKKITDFPYAKDAWWVNGTPADCVKLGIDYLLNFIPDLVISGINNGENLGQDVLYSGTVSAAVEGSLYGIKSFAASYSGKDFINIDIACSEAVSLISIIINNKAFTSEIVMNINIPEVKDEDNKMKIMVTTLGDKKYIKNFEKRIDPRGREYYWMAGDLDNSLKLKEGSDVFAIRNGFISITPINLFSTDIKTKKILESLEL